MSNLPEMDRHFTAAQRAYLEDYLLNPLTSVVVRLQLIRQRLTRLERRLLTGGMPEDYEIVQDLQRFCQTALDGIPALVTRIRTLDQEGKEDGDDSS